MGWRPSDIRDASLADFVAAVDGWLDAQGVSVNQMTEDEAQTARRDMFGDDL